METKQRKPYVLGARIELRNLEKIRARLEALNMSASDYVRHLVERDLHAV